MNFKKYNSIENSYNKKTIKYIHENEFSKWDWLVFEKVHWANFSIWSDWEKVWYAKRSWVIWDNDNFFNYKVAVEKYEDQVKALAKRMNDTIGIFWELFGWVYPWEKSEYKWVQWGVYYTNTIEFIAFDIYSLEWGMYLDIIHSMQLLNHHKIPHLDVMYQWSFKDCLKHSNEFQTTIPSFYWLPEIDGNMCEGVVIRPIEEKLFGNWKRVILKNKNEKFSEKTSKKKNSKPRPPHVLETLERMMEYLNDNRVESAISKIGNVTKENIWEIIHEVVNDIVTEYVEENWKISEEEEEFARKSLSRSSARKVLQYI